MVFNPTHLGPLDMVLGSPGGPSFGSLWVYNGIIPASYRHFTDAGVIRARHYTDNIRHYTGILPMLAVYRHHAGIVYAYGHYLLW